ncbi:tyrosine-type recombinase/integrase [Vibrio sp. ER1A]|uniref:tyrosine-type recombinase/integrase n=1 Tax=Vibrio sp. ER1A TaxID=1517681 RepID=UPI000AD923D3|nr:tyrosine-type recombinase/integrase [Vibrio sp. ER1A]
MSTKTSELDHIDEFVNWKRDSENCSQRTVNKYRKLLEQLSEYMKNGYKEASLADLERFSGGWLHHKGYSAASRKVAVAAVRGFYQYLHKRRIIDRNPAADLVYPKIGRRLPRYMELHSAEKLLLQPDLDSFSGLRDSAILSLMIGCGFRVGGVSELNESSLMWYQYEGADRLAIRVLEKGERERIVPVPCEAMLLLQAYLGHSDLTSMDRLLADGDQVLFVNVRNRHIPEWEHRGEARRISTRAIDRMIKKYALAAGVPEEHAHPHALRHLFGTELAESDMNTLQIQALMGHADPKTSAIYAHIAKRKLTQLQDSSNPLGKMNTPVTALMNEMKKGKAI